MIWSFAKRHRWILALLVLAVLIGDARATEPEAFLPGLSAPKDTTPSLPRFNPIISLPETKAAEAAPAAPTNGKLVWLDDLGEAHRRARADGRPVLVRVMAGWCEGCRELKKSMAENEDLQTELARWNLVHIDVTARPTDIRELQSGGVPALFVRAASGRPVASQVGEQTPERLLAWLKDNYAKASAAPDELLLDASAPDEPTVARLVGELDDRDPILRQAAIERLAAHPAVARAAVVKAFGEGRLATRLSALEALRRWRAPVENMDPWRPDTFTPQTLARLGEWSDEMGSAAASKLTEQNHEAEQPKILTDAELAEARAEIDRLLRGTDYEALAAAARLAGVGRSLLPEVTQRLAKAETDHDLRRLRMLRYRLLASDTLALRWPGGLARLADTDASQRQKAAEELVKMAGPADAALLLALFGDTDPLVREIGLRGLQEAGGDEATTALIDLLSDPEPNVRAAVLKQLEEKPRPDMVPRVAKYLETEKDADLVVHAVRVFRVAKNKDAMESLLKLLKHDVWQVRAEAAAAVGEVADSMSAEEKARIYAKLIELLRDSDPFVVSRAVESVAGEDLVVAVDPMIEAATRYPELASSIMETLSRRSKMREVAAPKIRKMAKHKDPRIRAAVLTALASSADANMGDEILTGLDDPSEEVRLAASGLLFTVLDQKRQGALSQIEAARDPRDPLESSPEFIQYPPSAPKPSLMESFAQGVAGLFDGRNLPASEKDNSSTKPAAPTKEPAAAVENAVEKVKDVSSTVKPADSPTYLKPDETTPTKTPQTPPEPEKKKPKNPEPKKKEPPKVDPYDAWLADFYQGKDRPDWAAKAEKPLLKMFQSKEVREKMAAAACLIALGRVDTAYPVVAELPKTNPETFEAAARMLAWLTWEKRAELFDRLLDLAAAPDEYSTLIEAMTSVRDARTTDRLWGMLSRKNASSSFLTVLQRGLHNAYIGENYYYSPYSSQMSDADKQRLKEEASARVAKGNPSQRLVALSLMLGVLPNDAAAAARQLVADASLPAEFHRDAFRALLLTLNNDGKHDLALAEAAKALTDDKSLRPIALAYLANDVSSLQQAEAGFWLSHSLTIHGEGYASGQPIVPQPPKGLKPEHIQDLIRDQDPKTAAYAGYLMTLLGRPEGLKPLIDHWQSLSSRDWEENRLIVRAVAVLDDSTKIDLLRKIYKETDQWRMREFYWTIRAMTGPEILKFRKQIRDEVGMTNLR